MSKMKDLAEVMRRINEDIDAEIDRSRQFAKDHKQYHLFDVAKGLEEAKQIIDNHIKT